MLVEGTKITPDNGKMLFNGKTYSDCVFVGVLDSVDNWKEVPYSQYEEYANRQEKIENINDVTENAFDVGLE